MKDYFAGLRGVVVTHVTQAKNEGVTNEQQPQAARDEAVAEVLPTLPMLPLKYDMSCLKDCIDQVQGATTIDKAWRIIEQFRQSDWSHEERDTFWQAYMPILERFYANTDDYLVDGVPATPRERVQIEKTMRGWYLRKNQHKAVAT